MSSSVKLYSYFRSTSAWRVRLALLYKEIPYTYSPVHLLNNGGEQNQPDYAALNPNREVPTLEIDGHILCQSIAIMEYLEETRPEHPLLPVDPYLRSKVRQIVDIVVANIQPVQNLRVIKKLGDDVNPEYKASWAKHWITVGFEGLEAVLSKTAGTCCVGDELSMADFCVIPQVFNARRFNVDLSPFPTIVRLDAALSGTDLFKKAAPESQPDCPPDAK